MQRHLSQGLELSARCCGDGLDFGLCFKHQHLQKFVFLQVLSSSPKDGFEEFLKPLVLPYARVSESECDWEVRWLNIDDYGNVYPEIEHLSSLKYFHLRGGGSIA